MTFEIALVNIADGTVQGHAAGCADLKRGSLRKHADQAWTFEVEDKADAWMSYNSDFLAEGGEDNAYDIDWKPCANHVTEGDTHARYEAEFGDTTPVAYQSEVVTHEPVVTTRVGRKWTYVFVDGDEVAYVRNDQVATVLQVLAVR